MLPKRAESPDLRVRPGILRGALEPYDSQHEADHCQDDEANMAAGENLVVLGESAAAAEPAVCALDNPALGPSSSRTLA
jgi:hypothetical protein